MLMQNERAHKIQKHNIYLLNLYAIRDNFHTAPFPPIQMLSASEI